MKGPCNMSYNDDKRELLKLKQGLIEESETIKEISHEENIDYEVKGFGKKIVNFFYHYKWHVIVIAFFVSLTFFLAYTTITKEKGDIRILAFAENRITTSSLYFKTEDISIAFEQYASDYDGNGYIHAEVFYMDMNPDQDSNYYIANQTKLYSEISTGTAQIYMGDREQLLAVLGDQKESSGYVDLSALYPDCPSIVDNYYYHVKGSQFAEMAMYMESCPEDLYIAVRSLEFSSFASQGKNIEEYHARAMEVMDHIINDIKSGIEG